MSIYRSVSKVADCDINNAVDRCAHGFRFCVSCLIEVDSLTLAPSTPDVNAPNRDGDGIDGLKLALSMHKINEGIGESRDIDVVKTFLDKVRNRFRELKRLD